MLKAEIVRNIVDGAVSQLVSDFPYDVKTGFVMVSRIDLLDDVTDERHVAEAQHGHLFIEQLLFAQSFPISVTPNKVMVVIAPLPPEPFLIG